MFVGHALLALALVAVVARWRGWSAERALALGAVAALFATAPDVDVAYAPVGLVGAVASGAGLLDGFWAASSVTHRTVTHSLVVAVPAAVGFAALPRRPAVAGVLLAGLVALAAVVTGPLAAVVTALFVVAGGVVAALAATLGFGPRATLGAALGGLLTHPFGDLFTGGPPSFLYPFDVTLVGARVAPFADPTLDLFLAFGVELAAVWVGVATVAWLHGARLRDHLRTRAVTGAGYAPAVALLPQPTVDAAYGFVVGVLAVGAVAGVRRGDGVAAWVVTGLTSVTVAGLAFALAYAGEAFRLPLP
jgi:hypothetical protein